MICLHQSKQKVVINSFYYPSLSIYCVLAILGKIWIIFPCIFTHVRSILHWFSQNNSFACIYPWLRKTNLWVRQSTFLTIKHSVSYWTWANVHGEANLKTLAWAIGLIPMYSLKRDLRNVNCNLWHYRSSFYGIILKLRSQIHIEV